MARDNQNSRSGRGQGKHNSGRGQGNAIHTIRQNYATKNKN